MMITAHVSYFTLHQVLLHALYIQLGCEDLIREHIYHRLPLCLTQ